MIRDYHEGTITRQERLVPQVRVFLNWVNGHGLPKGLYELENRTVLALFALQAEWRQIQAGE